MLSLNFNKQINTNDEPNRNRPACSACSFTAVAVCMLCIGEKQYKFEEILPIYKAVSDETDIGTFADFMEAFKTFDREGQGFIASAELRHVLTSLGSFSSN
jgi:hypothetical protein